MENIYFFHWPSNLGGADTRLKDLVSLFSETNKYNLFCIPNDDFRLNEQDNVNFLLKNKVKILTWETLPEKTTGYAIAFCNFRLFQENWRLQKIKNIGLKFIWSNDMMWSTKEEFEAFENKLVAATIFTSEFHHKKLSLINENFKKTINFNIPNYFHFSNYENYPIKKYTHLNDKFVIGKLSRSEWTKYSENFPLLFSKINIPNAHFRFMGWSKDLEKKYSWFKFNNNFELLTENVESPLDFLSQLDLYVFNCHHNYTENQSRSIIEAQLLGIPCIAPKEGNFPNMIWHERTGLLYNNIEELYYYIEILYKNNNLRNEIKYNSLNLSKTIWCNKELQLQYWESLFSIL